MKINAHRVLERKAGRAAAESVLSLIRDETAGLSAWAAEAFWETIVKAAPPAAQALPRACKEPKPAAPEPTRNGDATRAALETAGRILEKVEDLPTEARDFGVSVEETTRGIIETICRTERVTYGQREALENMEHGVDAWLHGERETDEDEENSNG